MLVQFVLDKRWPGKRDNSVVMLAWSFVDDLSKTPLVSRTNPVSEAMSPSNGRLLTLDPT